MCYEKLNILDKMGNWGPWERKLSHLQYFRSKLNLKHNEVGEERKNRGTGTEKKRKHTLISSDN